MAADSGARMCLERAKFHGSPRAGWRWPALALVLALAAGCGDGGSGGGDAAATGSSPEAGSADALVEDGGGGAATSDAKVDVSAERVSTGGGEAIEIGLVIAPGWHVNANPASLDFLIPTAVTVRRDGTAIDAEPVYPPGEALEVPFGDGSIAVYGEVETIRVPLGDAGTETGTGAYEAAVEVQACNDEGRCLAPATVVREVEAPAG